MYYFAQNNWGVAGHHGDNSGDILQWDDFGHLSSRKQWNSKFTLQLPVTISSPLSVVLVS